jgi:hypothetical protein
MRYLIKFILNAHVFRCAGLVVCILAPLSLVECSSGAVNSESIGGLEKVDIPRDEKLTYDDLVFSALVYSSFYENIKLKTMTVEEFWRSVDSSGVIDAEEFHYSVAITKSIASDVEHLLLDLRAVLAALEN